MGGAAAPDGDAAPLFPDDYDSGMGRACEVWDLSRLLPIPRRRFACPICGGDLALKDWKHHKRTRVGSASPWRCDVRMKCMTCGFVPTFGVLVTQEMYERAAQVLGAKRGTWIHWRVGRKAMEEGSDGV